MLSLSIYVVCNWQITSVQSSFHCQVISSDQITKQIWSTHLGNGSYICLSVEILTSWPANLQFYFNFGSRATFCFLFCFNYLVETGFSYTVFLTSCVRDRMAGTARYVNHFWQSTMTFRQNCRTAIAATAQTHSVVFVYGAGMPRP